MPNFKAYYTITENHDYVRQFDYSYQNHQLCSISDDGVIRVHDLENLHPSNELDTMVSIF